MHDTRTVTAKALAFGVLLGCLLFAGALVADPQAQQPVPTLVPPTLVPTVESNMVDALPSESAVARLQRDGKLRVGILFNEPPFGELNIRGEVSGFDADLARALAEVWGVEVEFKQVTRQTALEMLLGDDVDLLVAAQPRTRDLDALVEFSQAYYPGAQMMLVREGDGAAVLGHMDGRKVGVVMGTRGEAAVNEWLARTHLSVAVQQYFTLDQALSALRAGDMDGVVESRIKLTRVMTEPGVFRFVEDPVSNEPYAVVMRRQDANMRDLVDRTLQYLFNSGKLDEIHKAHFAGASYPRDQIPVWLNLGEDAPTPAQFGADIAFPAQYVVPRLQDGGALRVAGVADVPDDADESQKRLDAYNRALIEAMAARWGARVEYVPDSTGNALDLVASGQADIAVGVQPDWAWADRVDFTSPYLLHGQRLMVAADSEVSGFAGLRGKWIGIFASEEGAGDRVNELAEAARTRVSLYMLANEEDAAFGMLVQNNYDAAFGDSLRLIPHVEANPEDLRLATNDENGGWFSRTYVAFGLPRNDIDFRLLVDYSLQELSRDGTLALLMQPVMLPEESLRIPAIPGSSDYLGFHLAAS